MNAKKVKVIRHSMRNAGVDCRDAKYTVGAWSMCWSMWFYGHVTLDPKCGRAKYKVIKRVAA